MARHESLPLLPQTQAAPDASVRRSRWVDIARSSCRPACALHRSLKPSRPPIHCPGHAEEWPATVNSTFHWGISLSERARTA